METKPGVYTTEFWVTLLGNGVGVVNLLGWWDYVPNKVALLFMAIINAAYSVARGQAKQGVAADPTVAGNYKVFPRARDMIKRP